MVKNLLLVSVLLCVHSTWAGEMDLDFNSILQFSQFSSLAQNTPFAEFLNETTPEQLLNMTLKGITDKCVEVSGSEQSFDNLKNGAEQFGECLGDLMDVEVFKNEIELFSKNGSLEEVFGKYCGRRQRAVQCMDTFISQANACLSPSEQTQLGKGRSMVFELLQFLCFKEGDHIALFIAEDGPQCFNASQGGLQKCVEAQVESYKSANATGPFDFDFSSLSCNDIDPFKNCGVIELEKCENSTPANLFESLLRYVKKKCTELA